MRISFYAILVMFLSIWFSLFMIVYYAKQINENLEKILEISENAEDGVTS